VFRTAPARSDRPVRLLHRSRRTTGRRTSQHTNLLCQCTYIRDFHIRLRLGWRCGATTRMRVASVDPDSVQAECPGWRDVVIEALSDMENFLWWDTDARQSHLEIVRGRLVGLRLLCGDNPIELHV